MPDPTNAARQRRFRERQAGRLAEVLTCTSCSKRHIGAHGGLCRDCWRRTPEGREWQRLRIAAYRARNRQP
jgi:hypothetical protein